MSHPTDRPPLRVASVSYLNAKPLIFGLENSPLLTLHLDVPSHLLAGLQDGLFDVALLPVIDYQRHPGLLIVPAGGIGCDGPTLTVRIFSRVPIEQIRTLACDTDSHTSVALARVILEDLHHLSPTFIDFTPAERSVDTILPQTDAMLLIGDKVVVREPSRSDFPFQIDLGQAWKTLTGLPFVFAVWTARAGVDLGELPLVLSRARLDGLNHVDQIITDHAVPKGWPASLARQYLTSYLHYDIQKPQLQAIQTFHARAARHGLIPSPPRPLSIA